MLRGHQNWLSSATFSPGGDRILTAAHDGTARLWDLDGTELVVMNPGDGVIWSAVFSPSGDRVLTAANDRTACLWDLQGNELAVFTGGHSGPVTSAIFSPSGHRILTASSDGSASLWIGSAAALLDLAEQRETRDFTAAERQKYGDLLGDGKRGG